MDAKQHLDQLNYELQYTAARQFALLLNRYRSEQPGIREVIDSMAEILVDDSTTEDERLAATHTLMEALFPSGAVEW